MRPAIILAMESLLIGYVWATCPADAFKLVIALSLISILGAWWLYGNQLIYESLKESRRAAEK